MKNLAIILTVIFVTIFSACSGGSSSTTTKTSLYTIGGVVSQLNGSLVLQNNLSDDLTLGSDGNFTFSKRYPTNSDYNVTILTQPLQQLCTITNAVGTISSSNITNIRVDCLHINQAPIAIDDTAETNRSIPVVIDVLDNDTDSDGTLDVSSLAIVSDVTNGTTDINFSNGAVTYTPTDFYIGADTFTYTIKDNNGSLSNLATVTITVNNDRCWVNISNDVLDVNQSLGDEQASLTIDRSTNKLYASWVEGTWSGGDYIVKEFDQDTKQWTRLSGIINDRNVTAWARPITKIRPVDKVPFLLGYGDEGTYSRGYFIKNWDSAQWGLYYSKDDFMKAYDMAIGSNSKLYVTKIDSNNVVVEIHDGSPDPTLLPSIDEDDALSLPQIVLTQTNDPIIGYYHTNDYAYSRVSEYVNSTWVLLDSLESNASRQVVCMSMLVDASNDLVVGYVEQNVPNQGGDEQTVNVKRYHNNAWQLIGDTLNGTTSVNTSGGLEAGGNSYNQCMSLTEAANGDLYVAWQHKENGRNSIYTQTYDGTTWSDAAKPLIDDSNLRTPSLVVDSQGRMIISVLYDSTPGTTDMDDIKVFRCEP